MQLHDVVSSCVCLGKKVNWIALIQLIIIIYFSSFQAHFRLVDKIGLLVLFEAVEWTLKKKKSKAP